MKGSAAASSGTAPATVSDSSAMYSRVTAPIATDPFAAEIPDSSSMPLMSMSTAGRASRSASSGIRLWPPASTLASSSCSPSRSIASATVVGASYSTGGSFIGAALRIGAGALQRAWYGHWHGQGDDPSLLARRYRSHGHRDELS